MAETTIKLKGDSEDAKRAVRSLDAEVGKLATGLGGVVKGAALVGLGALGLREGAAALRMAFSQVSQAMGAYVAATPSAQAETTRLGDAYRALQADIGGAILGGDNLAVVVSALTGVMGALRGEVRENQDAVQALTREGFADAIEVTGTLIEVGAALADGYQTMRIAVAAVHTAILEFTGVLAMAGSIIVEGVVQSFRVLWETIGGVIEVMAHASGAVGAAGLSGALFDASNAIGEMTTETAELELRINNFRDAVGIQMERDIAAFHGTVNDATDRMIAHEEAVDSARGALDGYAQQVRDGVTTQDALTESTGRSTHALREQAEAMRMVFSEEEAIANLKDHEVATGKIGPDMKGEATQREIDALERRQEAGRAYTESIAAEFAAVASGQKSALEGIRDLVGQELITKGTARALEAATLAFVPGMQASAIGMGAGAAAMIAAGAAMSRSGGGHSGGGAASRGQAPAHIGASATPTQTTYNLSLSMGIVGDPREAAALVGRQLRRAIDDGHPSVAGLRVG